MTQWENLPEPRPEPQLPPVTPAWSAFTADPRVPANQHLRASDADRDVATRLLQQARAEGRLDAAELDTRVLAVGTSRTLGELVPLVADLMVAGAAPGPAVGRPVRAGRILIGWVGLAVLLNAIWLMTVLTTGRLLYYWPMWPMVITGIPMLMGVLWGGREDGHALPPPAGRDERRALQRARRAERRALRRGDTPQLPPRQDPPSDDLR